MIRTTRGPARLFVVLLARALRPYVDSVPSLDDGGRGQTRAALELARNATFALLEEPDLDAHGLLADMLRHRLANEWITCGDVRSASSNAAEVWNRIAARSARAA